MTQVIAYPDRAAQAEALASEVAESLGRVLANKGRAVLCVPGGTTPAKFFSALAQKPLDWEAVIVILGDERWVPPDHERSNARLLRETLLIGEAAAARLLPFYRDADTPEDGLAATAAELRAKLLPIDVLVLGMGEDMHTASLFPGADRLAEALDPEGAALILPMRAPGAPEPRITLTLPALLTANETHLLIAGAGKLKALEGARKAGPEAEAPIRAILNRASPRIHYAP